VSLVTRCHVCATAFRVHREQLAARAGKVRCGKCGAVFDGIAGLVEEGPERLRIEPSPQLGLFDPGRRPARAAPPPANDAEDDADVPVPEFLVREERPRRTLLWALLAFVAASGLAAQAAYRYRTELAVLVPDTRAPLEAACQALGCDVPLPRRPDLIGIESSDLQTDARRDDVIVLNAVLRNRAPFPQEYPALELTLTDDADRPVLRRVLRPAEYLEPARAGQLASGIAAGSEAAFRVQLEAGRNRATGYRLYLFFPQSS
jgi:predicted Zn finger-like uncharacterized protein